MLHWKKTDSLGGWSHMKTFNFNALFTLSFCFYYHLVLDYHLLYVDILPWGNSFLGELWQCPDSVVSYSPDTCLGCGNREYIKEVDHHQNIKPHKNYLEDQGLGVALGDIIFHTPNCVRW